MRTGAVSEARTFANMVRLGSATVESARADIGSSTPYRRKVLLHFDIRRGCISSDVRRTIVRLRLLYPESKVHDLLGIPYRVIRLISEEEGILFRKTGRGRRLSAELREKILAAVKAGQRSAEIERQFHVDYDTVTAFRHALGDFENRRHWTKLSPQQISEATAALQSGQHWLHVAARFGVALATLQRHITYRKGKK